MIIDLEFTALSSQVIEQSMQIVKQFKNLAWDECEVYEMLQKNGVSTYKFTRIEFEGFILKFSDTLYQKACSEIYMENDERA